MRDEAESRIGHLYPKIRVTEAMAAERDDLRPYTGKDLTVIAWLWARTVASPDPMMRGAHVPLVSSFVLSSKNGKQAIIGPTIDHASRTYRFVVKSSGIGPDEYVHARKGTKAGRGSNFTCLVSGHRSPATTSRPRAWPDAWAHACWRSWRKGNALASIWTPQGRWRKSREAPSPSGGQRGAYRSD